MKSIAKDKAYSASIPKITRSSLVKAVFFRGILIHFLEALDKKRHLWRDPDIEDQRHLVLHAARQAEKSLESIGGFFARGGFGLYS